MLGSLILYLKGRRRTMFQLSGFYHNCLKNSNPDHILCYQCLHILRIESGQETRASFRDAALKILIFKVTLRRRRKIGVSGLNRSLALGFWQGSLMHSGFQLNLYHTLGIPSWKHRPNSDVLFWFRFRLPNSPKATAHQRPWTLTTEVSTAPPEAFVSSYVLQNTVVVLVSEGLVKMQPPWPVRQAPDG